MLPLRAKAAAPRALLTATALALLLHAGALLWLLAQSTHRPAPPSAAPFSWQVSLRQPPAPALASPAAPAPAPDRPPQAQPDTRSRAPHASASPRPAPLAAPDSAALTEPNPAAFEPAPAPLTQASAQLPARWLEATQADHAPAPQANEWRLADLPWPADPPRVRVRLWISAQGRIERFELQGAAASNPALQALFAPIVHTPMLPARIGAVHVPSTMLVEIWPGDDAGRPDFIAPLP